MKLRHLIDNPSLQTATKRVIFSLLAIWVHFAVLFYVTMVLFSRGESRPDPSPMLPSQERNIEVSLKAPEIALPEPALPQPAPLERPPEPPKSDDPGIAQATSAKPEPIPPQEPQQPAPPKTPAVPEQSAQPAEVAQTAKPPDSDGVLDCSTLTVKPRMIVSGEAVMRLQDIDSTAGTTTIKEKITRNGTVVDVQIESSTMTRKMQDQVVNSAFHGVFSPGQMGGVPVDCTVRFKVSSDGSQ